MERERFIEPLKDPVCPYCKDEIVSGNLVKCEGCKTLYHGMCWRENYGCATLGCAGNLKQKCEEAPKKEFDLEEAIRNKECAEFDVPREYLEAAKQHGQCQTEEKPAQIERVWKLGILLSFAGLALSLIAIGITGVPYIYAVPLLVCWTIFIVIGTNHVSK